MKRVLASLLIAVFMAQSIQAQAAPSVASVQRDIDRLRTLAAEKYEEANEATIRIKTLQKETGALQQREAIIQGELSVVSKVLAKIAISEYQGSGFGNGQANVNNPTSCYELALKEAETDATKRALKSMGSQFGIYIIFCFRFYIFVTRF